MASPNCKHDKRKNLASATDVNILAHFWKFFSDSDPSLLAEGPPLEQMRSHVSSRVGLSSAYGYQTPVSALGIKHAFRVGCGLLGQTLQSLPPLME
jgi:hypothetical protein